MSKFCILPRCLSLPLGTHRCGGRPFFLSLAHFASTLLWNLAIGTLTVLFWKKKALSTLSRAIVPSCMSPRAAQPRGVILHLSLRLRHAHAEKP